MLPDINTGAIQFDQGRAAPSTLRIFDKGDYYLGNCLRNNSQSPTLSLQPVPGHRVSLFAIGATCFTICAIRLEPRAG
jgi:hypothetical protein